MLYPRLLLIPAQITLLRMPASAESLHRKTYITAVMDGYQRRCADQLRQAYLVDLRCSGYGSFSNTAAWL